MILILMKTPWKPSSLTVEDYIIGTPLPSPALNLFLRAGTYSIKELFWVIDCGLMLFAYGCLVLDHSRYELVFHHMYMDSDGVVRMLSAVSGFLSTASVYSMV